MKPLLTVKEASSTASGKAGNALHVGLSEVYPLPKGRQGPTISPR